MTRRNAKRADWRRTDPHVMLGFQQALALEDIPSEGVNSAEAALARLDDDFAGVVVSDIRLPGMDGLTLQKQLAARDRKLPVILITGHGGYLDGGQRHPARRL